VGEENGLLSSSLCRRKPAKYVSNYLKGEEGGGDGFGGKDAVVFVPGGRPRAAKTTSYKKEEERDFCSPRGGLRRELSSSRELVCSASGSKKGGQRAGLSGISHYGGGKKREILFPGGEDEAFLADGREKEKEGKSKDKTLNKEGRSRSRRKKEQKGRPLSL